MATFAFMMAMVIFQALCGRRPFGDTIQSTRVIYLAIDTIPILSVSISFYSPPRSIDPLYTHPAIINNPPKGVTGPNTFPTFSLANTRAKILPENMTVPLMISGAAHLATAGALRRSKDGLAVYIPTARRASPL